MRESMPVTIRDAYPIDTASEVLVGFPQEHLQRFKDEVEASVESVLAEFGVQTEADVHNLPLSEWTALRNRLLAINIKLQPSGEITRE